MDMIIFSGNGLPPLVGSAQQGKARSPLSSPTKTDVDRHFDQITITPKDGENAFMMELKNKISQEVRTATTIGTIASLREQFQAGEYRVDAASIARKILLLEEE